MIVNERPPRVFDHGYRLLGNGTMATFSTIAAVDLGTNSFHCQIARMEGGHIHPLDNIREPVRLGDGLDANYVLDEASQGRALDCLHRFAERLRSFHPDNVRALGTCAFRVAKNASAFLDRAQAALGFPIEVVAGREEARLIYLGVSHGLPYSRERRLVIDIGGGSTEFIVGEGFKPLRLESLFMGCVSYSRRYFSDGVITKRSFRDAELGARSELQHIVSRFSRRHWQHAFGSSGTIRSVAQALARSGQEEGEISLQGLAKMREQLLRFGHVSRISITGLREDRISVLPAGVAILNAIFDELGIERLRTASASLREGILIDSLGRIQHHDRREMTVAHLMNVYRVDEMQAMRVSKLALSLYERMGSSASGSALDLKWAAQLHEIGVSVAFDRYHRHSAYILANADMPGFTRQEQMQVANLAAMHRRSLHKRASRLESEPDWCKILALRLAVLFCRRRAKSNPHIVSLTATGVDFELEIEEKWLSRHPLTHGALLEEAAQWGKIGVELKVRGVRAEKAA